MIKFSLKSLYSNYSLGFYKPIIYAFLKPNNRLARNKTFDFCKETSQFYVEAKSDKKWALFAKCFNLLQLKLGTCATI